MNTMYTIECQEKSMTFLMLVSLRLDTMGVTLHVNKPTNHLCNSCTHPQYLKLLYKHSHASSNEHTHTNIPKVMIREVWKLSLGRVRSAQVILRSEPCSSCTFAKPWTTLRWTLYPARAYIEPTPHLLRWSKSHETLLIFFSYYYDSTHILCPFIS